MCCISRHNPHRSLPVWWSWSQVRMNSTRCSCMWTGSLTLWCCWWWVWTSPHRPVCSVCSVPLCIVLIESPSLFPTHFPSMPTPGTNTQQTNTRWERSLACTSHLNKHTVREITRMHFTFKSPVFVRDGMHFGKSAGRNVQVQDDTDNYSLS